MIYRDEAKRIKGVWNKSVEFTSDRHVIAYAENGLTDLEQWLSKTAPKWRARSSRNNQAAPSWDLDTGYDGATRLAKDGWSEGARDLDHRLQAIMPASGREARWGYSVAGSSPNVGRYLRGNPNNMRTKKRKTAGAAPVFHIVYNGTASCMVTAEQMANYGTALVGLIDRLENAGRRVMLDVLYVTHAQSGSGRPVFRLATGWNVKKANEPIDLAAVAFSMAHPAAFRRLGFAMLERCPQESETYGYGHCADILECDVPDPTPGTMLLDGVNHEPSRCNSPEDALRLACEQLCKAAVLAGHATVDQPLIEIDDIF